MSAAPRRAPATAPALHRGSVLARAVLLDGRRRPRDLAQAAVALWEPGLLVHALDTGLLVRFPRDRRLLCHDAPGLPLVEAGGGLWAYPPTEAELRAGSGQLHLLRAGEPVAVPLTALPLVDLADALAVDAPLASVEPLGPPPPALPVRVDPDARARLGRAPLGAEALDVLRAARARAPTPEGPGLLARAAAALVGWLDRRRAAPAATSAGASAGTSGSAAAAAPALPAPRGPGWFDALLRRVALPALAPWIGRRYGRYLADLLARFDAGDLDEALRRAIPLGGEAGPDGPLALGLPDRRDSLSPLGPRDGGGSAIGADEQLFRLLRETYQRALDKLVAAGRVEDAAFVLAELLRDPRRAVDLLEKHEKWALAAELADHARLGPEVVARLWVRAGQLDRAIAHARRTASFAQCLPVVEAADPARGRAFRAAWAAHLAAGGDPATAVGVSWPVAELRPLALRWLDDALAVGGPAGARLLPLRLTAEPDRFEEVRAHVQALLAADDPDARAVRVALADGLVAAPSPGARALARPVLRRLVADQAAAPAEVPHPTLVQLADRAGDPALTFDLPRPAAASHAVLLPVRHVLDAAERGSAPIADAVPLPRGRVLLALGEAGCRVLDRTGRVVAVLDEPADRLVLHDAGTRALAVARRGDVARLARLDLEALTGARWFDAPLGPFADTFDGSLWFVAENDRILALDPLAERPSALWSVATGGVIEALERTPARVTTVVGGHGHEIWRYALPNLRLTERVARAMPVWPKGWLHHGTWIEAQKLEPPTPGDPPRLALRLEAPSRAQPESLVVPLTAPTLSGRPLLLARAGDRAVVAYVTEGPSVVIDVRDRTFALTTIRLELRGAARARVRLFGDRLAACDDVGRAELLHLATGARTTSIRL